MAAKFVGYRPSFIDLLIDPESAGTKDYSGYSELKFVQSVRRDLENILNTHRPTDETLGLDRYPTLRGTIVAFGLPDMSDARFLREDNRREVCDRITRAINDFEPRLADVKVTVRDTDALKAALKGDYRHTSLYFHIAARLKMDPSPPVAFETVMELSKAQTKIEIEGVEGEG